MLQVLTGLLAMCLIITFELWQSNKRLKRMLELDKQKMARLFDENRALEDKAFNIVSQSRYRVRIMNKILILLLVIGYGIAGTEDYNYKCEKALQHNKKEQCKVVK